MGAAPCRIRLSSPTNVRQIFVHKIWKKVFHSVSLPRTPDERLRGTHSNDRVQVRVLAHVHDVKGAAGGDGSAHRALVRAHLGARERALELDRCRAEEGARDDQLAHVIRRAATHGEELAVGALDERVERAEARHESVTVRHVYAELAGNIRGAVVERASLSARGERGELLRAVVDRAPQEVGERVGRAGPDKRTLFGVRREDRRKR